jgi:hypothetical protein
MGSSMTRTEILDTAKSLITQDRQQEYGEAKESFERIANLWQSYLGYPITSHDVSMMMVLLKVSRAKHSNNSDSLVDIAGYAALASELVDE